MTTTILGLLAALMKLIELLLQRGSQSKKDSHDYEAILELRKYRERLQQALLARKKVSSTSPLPNGNDSLSDGLSDDGFRRD